MEPPIIANAALLGSSMTTASALGSVRETAGLEIARRDSYLMPPPAAPDRGVGDSRRAPVRWFATARLALSGGVAPIDNPTQKEIFWKMGLPVIPGTDPGETDWKAIVDQLLQVGLAEGENGSTRLKAPVWLKDKRVKSLAINDLESLHWILSNNKNHPRMEEAVVELYFPSAYVVSVLFDSIKTPSGLNLSEIGFLTHRRPSRPSEETLPFELTDAMKDEVLQHCRTAVRSGGYEGERTAKFLVDPRSGKLFILKIKEGLDLGAAPFRNLVTARMSNEDRKSLVQLLQQLTEAVQAGRATPGERELCDRIFRILLRRIDAYIEDIREGIARGENFRDMNKRLGLT
jgi:hypothetical protein